MNRTQLREARRDVRRILGTSSDAPPNLSQLLCASARLSEMVRGTSAHYRLELTRDGLPITYPAAIEAEQAYRAERTHRL